MTIKQSIIKLLKEAEEKAEDNSNETSSSSSTEDTEETSSDTENKDNSEKGEEKEEKEEFTADSLEDFLTKTETKISVKKEGCEPSPIFGSNDKNNHNKYRITLSNPKGKISFIFWDSVLNTQKNKPVSKNNALICFAKDAEAYGESLSFEDFKANFGYDDTEENRAQKAYNGCQKNMKKAKEIFDEEQLKTLFKLASDY